ncbi:thymidine kinase [Companilactobacillus mishanensis]|uniref:Thymidine kinase n=1 Tax=Companilactobacillus mishanensis TaxID=2486008 RepID=A0A5P0ZGQ7_9LACO|nr:thymidine kinase [Companilactobacillus mishanensis]MQS44005.1 thymidine kinase [Companilactobacillus mishanensis]MQS52214.1 thymidine kinase [Companilactobacillus mishanensis]MQS88304.1 thymidine kinase [Companilactobacillus mishanensis]
MAQLFFKFGAMNSGKSIEILKVAHNYKEQGKSVILMTSVLDTRSGTGKISSRIGLEADAIALKHDSDVYDIVKTKNTDAACVLIDECEFMTKEQVIQATQVVDKLGIPVMAFGLKNDFRNELFEGSKYLLLYADKLEEMKTICWFCKKKATMNMRMSDGKPVYEGDQIAIGGNEMYYPVCRRHYNNPPMLKDE